MSTQIHTRDIDRVFIVMSKIIIKIIIMIITTIIARMK